MPLASAVAWVPLAVGAPKFLEARVLTSDAGIAATIFGSSLPERALTRIKAASLVSSMTLAAYASARFSAA